MRYELRHPKESFHNTSITMDVDQCTIVTLHGKPMFTKVRSDSGGGRFLQLRLKAPRIEYQFHFAFQVYTEGRLIVEFTFDDMMRIRSWHFTVRNHRELIPRSILAMQQVSTFALEPLCPAPQVVRQFASFRTPGWWNRCQRTLPGRE